jgi:hypothetical protein
MKIYIRETCGVGERLQTVLRWAFLSITGMAYLKMTSLRPRQVTMDARGFQCVTSDRPLRVPQMIRD